MHTSPFTSCYSRTPVNGLGIGNASVTRERETNEKYDVYGSWLPFKCLYMHTKKKNRIRTRSLTASALRLCWLKKKYALFFRFSHSPKNLCKCERRERLELEWLNWISLMMLKLIKLLKGMMHQIFRFKIEILKSNFIAGV